MLIAEQMRDAQRGKPDEETQRVILETALPLCIIYGVKSLTVAWPLQTDVVQSLAEAGYVVERNGNGFAIIWGNDPDKQETGLSFRVAPVDFTQQS